MLLAAAATAFFSCQKPEVIVPETSQEVTLTFASEKPAFDDETKTEWTGTTIQWSEGDKISIAYTVAGNWQSKTGDAEKNAKLYKSDALTESTSVAQFNVSAYFEGTTDGTHVFYGVYPAPSETDFANAPVATVTVASNQNPKADSFDANGDLMVGVSGEYSSRPGDGETISLRWNRLVAHAVITLKNINGFTAGETIETITLTAQKDANLVGQQQVNLITKEVVKDNDDANVLKLAAGNLKVTDGTVSFWSCFLPETITSLTIAVETDKATYTREIESCNLEFKQNARNTLAIKMGNAVRVEKTVASDEVVDVLNRALTGITGTTYSSWSGKTSVSTAVYAGQSAGGNESIQLRSNNSNSGIVTTTSGGFAKKVVVMWNSNTSNGRTLDVYGSNTAYTNPTELYNSDTQGTKLGSIVCGTSTELVIDGDYEYIGMRSASSAMYIGQISITWESGVPDTTPKIVVSGDTTKDVVFGGETVTFNYELKNLEAEELTWEVSNPDMISSVSAENGKLTIAVAENNGEARTATITLSCGDAENVVLTIKQAKYVDTSVIEELTVAEFKNKEVSTEVWYKLTGTISNIYNTQYGNFYLTDEAGDQITVYGLKENESAGNQSFANLGLKEGDKVTLIGNVGEYNSNKQVVNAYHVSSEKLAAWDAPSISVAKNKVTITAADTGVKVYYTVDGNTPTESSTLYTDAFDITATVTVKAIAVADGRPDSSVSEKECEYVEQTGSEQGGGRADFETVTKTNTSYSSATTTARWTAANCAVLKGGTSNASPAFIMIGDESNRAFCMNGKTSAVGTITSPTLTDGCGTLSFSYGLPFSDTMIKFKVDIMQNGTVVKTFTVNPSSVAKLTAYTCEEAINVSGDFQIVFTNLSPSNSTSNKDRTAIWDVEWTGYSN